MGHACRVAIIGGGPAGIMTAALLREKCDVTIFDPKPLLSTILPTGGGKCNLSFLEDNFKEFAKNYPRGEKFLYSIFSRYCMQETVEFFERIGVDTVALDNGKIFPESMSAKFVREKLLAQINGCNVEKTLVVGLEKKDKGFIVHSENSKSLFDKVVVTTGGHCDFSFIRNLGVEVIPLKPALTGLCVKENFAEISGVVLKSVKNKETNFEEDLLFTHFGISGPLVFKISSIKARDEFPYSLTFDIVGEKFTSEKELQEVLNKNPHKEIKNILSEFLPKNFTPLFLKQLEVHETMPGHKINGKIRNSIYEGMKNFKINVTKPRPDGEIVMCGGVDLRQVNPKTLEHRSISGLYFAGEVLDIDGFCGGFNLQNCWSGAFVIRDHILGD